MCQINVGKLCFIRKPLLQTILTNARNADKIVREKFETNCAAIEMLSMDEVQNNDRKDMKTVKYLYTIIQYA